MKFRLLACVLSIGQAVPQGDSIVDAARRHGGAATVVIDIDSPVGTVEQLVIESSLILRGKIVSIVARLSKDERIVVTEYEIAPVTFYKGSFAVRSRPGQATLLIVQRPGGYMDLNGLKLGTNVNEFPDDEAPRNGEEMILFLARSETEPDRFRLSRLAFGAFRIVEGKVTALTAEAAADAGTRRRRYRSSNET